MKGVQMIDEKKEYDLSRFLKMHNQDYETALRELKGGRKYSHWMWYIFPQIAGLGHSQTAVFYSIVSLGEAKAYLDNEELGAHMNELCQVLLGLKTNFASSVFAYPDDMKLKSSMTLFEQADPANPVYGQVLDKYFHGERDSRTLQILKVRAK